MQEAGYRQVVAKINPIRFIRSTLLERYADDACSYQVTGRDYTIKNTINTVGIYFSLPGVTNPHHLLKGHRGSFSFNCRGNR